jgi:hypothetical protein
VLGKVPEVGRWPGRQKRRGRGEGAGAGHGYSWLTIARIHAGDGDVGAEDGEWWRGVARDHATAYWPVVVR